MKYIGCFASDNEERAHLRRLKGEEKYEALNEMIAVSNTLLFLAAQVFPRRAESRISAARTGCTISMMFVLTPISRNIC